EASSEAGLKEKREIFERASLAVLEESRQHGVASIATVTAARQKLLDFGPPGCRHVSPLSALTLRVAGPVGSTAGAHGRFRTQALSELSGLSLPAPAMRREKGGDIHHGRLRRAGG